MPRSTKRAPSSQQIPAISTVKATHRRSARLASAESGSKQLLLGNKPMNVSKVVKKSQKTHRNPRVAKSTKGKEPSVINEAEASIAKPPMKSGQHKRVKKSLYDRIDVQAPVLEALHAGRSTVEQQPSTVQAESDPSPIKQQDSRRTKRETTDMISWLRALGGSVSQEEIEHKAAQTNRSIESVQRWIIRNRHTARPPPRSPIAYPPALPPVSPPVTRHLAITSQRYHTPPTLPAPSPNSIPVPHPNHGPGPIRTPKRNLRRHSASPLGFSVYIPQSSMIPSSPSKVLVYDGTRVYRLSHSRTSSDEKRDPTSDAETVDDAGIGSYRDALDKEREAADALLFWRKDAIQSTS
ncbi:hypothetical protein FRC17_011200 [Serendipita sp. 399]|nr:hypothetical protein FRC17_011200 [Serendipita sp. 399]